VFVVGSPRSGTSILAWSLAQHPDLWTSAETDFLLYLFGPPLNDFFGRSRLDIAFERIDARPGGSWLEEHGIDRAEFAASVGRGLNELITRQAPGKRWIDQSPSYTVMLEALAELFPGASFLHILRDGRRVVHSMINSGFDTWWAQDFREACITWRRFVEAGMRFERIAPDRCMTVLLEELSEDPGESFGRILKFIEAPPDDAPARFFSGNRINSSYQPESRRGGAPQATGGAGSPAERSTAASDPWAAWTPEQRAIFATEAGAALVQYGYAAEEELSA
jgi:protein-tyrosine sulfotransferase